MSAVHAFGSAPDVALGGKYRLLAELGEGGTALVYLAVMQGPSGFNKLAVLKMLRPTLADELETRKMFLQEARVAARLNHPCIVQTYEVFDDGGLPVIVMEYLEGQPLSRILSRSRQTFPQAMHLRVIAETARGLQYAHELADYDGSPLGLVHRDVTPQNVFVTFDGETKLLDFGIAKLAVARSSSETGMIKGKLRYMPPEQIEGEPIDRRADIYALGAMLWEAATGREVWKGCADAEVMNRVLNGDVPLPSSVNPNVPAALEKVCMKALAHAPDDRYATAAELELELDRVMEELGNRATGRAVAKTMSELFADFRVETRKVIDEQLSKVASLSRDEYEAADVAVVSFPATDLVSGTRPREPAKSAVARSKRTWIIGAVGLVLLGALYWGRQKPTRQPEAAANVPAASASLPAPPRRVKMQLSALPAESRLFLDGELLPANPFERLLTADGAQHLLTAEAPGYESASTAFFAREETIVSLTLKRSSEARPVAKPRPAPKRVAAPSAGPARTPDCDPPYLVDAQGTKKFKIECL